MTFTIISNAAYARGDNRPTCENRVSRQNPCAWCGDTKYCLQFDDGNSFCRTEGAPDEWTEAFMGGYLHRTTDALPTPSARPTRPTRATTAIVEAADVDTQHAIYSALRALCPLSDAHRVLLTGPGHGLDDAQAELYGTLPADHTARRAIVDTLIQQHGAAALLGTPGFVRGASDRIDLSYRGGAILMPRRDLQGRITGVALRSDNPDAGQRYVWLSSAPDGPSCGSASHVATPAGGVRNPHTVYIVEGVKKADLIAERMGCLAISINGVGTWRAAEEVLDDLAGQGVDTCIIALDRDVKPTAIEHVERSRQRLAAAAVARGYAVRIASWDPAVAKGPDDLLIAGHKFTIERYCPPTVTAPRVDDTASIAGITPAADGGGCVTIDANLLNVLIRESVATATLRRKFQQQSALITDTRIKPGDKILTAAVWDMAMPEGRDPGPAAPRRVYRAALAERTGMNVSTISRKLQDAHNMGLITCESRRVATDDTELWVSVGRLPDSALTAADVNSLAQNRTRDRKRKRCPNCGSAHLQPATHRCANCHQTCTDEEALAAGRDAITLDSDAVINAETGEILTPAPMRADSARGQTTPHDSASSDTSSDVTEAPVTPCAESAHRTNNVVRCADSAQGSTERKSQPTGALMKPCAGGCGTPQLHGWTCKSCRMRQDSALHRPSRVAARQGV